MDVIIESSPQFRPLSSGCRAGCGCVHVFTLYLTRPSRLFVLLLWLTNQRYVVCAPVAVNTRMRCIG